MSEKKTIVINPDLFKIGSKDSDGQTNKRKTPRSRSIRTKTPKERQGKQLKAKQIRKELIRKLKEHNVRKHGEQQQNIRSLEEYKANSGTHERSQNHTDTNASSQEVFKPESFENAMSSIDNMIKQNKKKEIKTSQLQPQPQPPKIEISVPQTQPQQSTQHTYKVPLQERIQSQSYQKPVVHIQQTPHIKQQPIVQVSLDDFDNISQPEPSYQQQPTVSPIQLKEDPPYGCLKKGGMKPTYSQYTRKVKRPISFQETTQPNQPNQPNMSIDMNTNNTNNTNNVINTTFSQEPLQTSVAVQQLGLNDPIEKRKALLQKLQSEAKEEQTQQHILNVQNQLLRNDDDPKPFSKKVIKKKYLKRTFKLGKNKDKNRIEVLIKNQKTRKLITSDIKKQCNTNILDKKRFLKRHNLLKHGSIAPDYIINQLYEDAITSGELENKGDSVLLHNYLHDKDDIVG
jgi:hypothetical protein